MGRSDGEPPHSGGKPGSLEAYQTEVTRLFFGVLMLGCGGGAPAGPTASAPGPECGYPELEAFASAHGGIGAERRRRVSAYETRTVQEVPCESQEDDVTCEARARGVVAASGDVELEVRIDGEADGYRGVFTVDGQRHEGRYADLEALAEQMREHQEAGREAILLLAEQTYDPATRRAVVQARTQRVIQTDRPELAFRVVLADRAAASVMAALNDDAARRELLLTDVTHREGVYAVTASCP